MWARLADASGWKDWTSFTRSGLEQEGDPAPDGVGAMRRFGIGPITSVEEVVAFEPPTHFAYVLRKGLPVKGYRADVELASTPSGGTAHHLGVHLGQQPSAHRALAALPHLHRRSGGEGPGQGLTGRSGQRQQDVGQLGGPVARHHVVRVDLVVAPRG